MITVTLVAIVSTLYSLWATGGPHLCHIDDPQAVWPFVKCKSEDRKNLQMVDKKKTMNF